MPEIVETTVYRIGELDDAGRERAGDWFRQIAFDHEWYEFVYADFETVCHLTGVDLRTQPVRLTGGSTRQKPCIFFSGFCNQGDGACFEGSYAYAREAGKAIRAHALGDRTPHAIVDALQAAQRRNFYQLRANIQHEGRYHHEQTMAFSIERDSPTAQDLAADTEEALMESLRDLARWLYRRLRAEYDYSTSDAEIDEGLEASAYTFTWDGHRFG